jgi:hypothetical protein
MSQEQQPPPQWNPPPQQQWQSPPQQQWQSPPQQPPPGWGQQGYTMAPPARPGGVTFAGVFLIVMSILFFLFAAVAFLGGAAFGGLVGAEGAFVTGIFAFFAIILVVVGVAQLAAGIGALQGKGWGRITGLVISVIIVILLVLGLPNAFSDVGSLILNVGLIILYALAAWALYQAGPYFAYRR